MGMDTFVVGIRDMDGKFAEMLELKKLCEKSKVSYPKEVAEYFGNLVDEDVRYIKDEMLRVDLDDIAKEYTDGESCTGYEIVVKNIPKEVKVIRFFNSW
jgi:hypothetical protein